MGRSGRGKGTGPCHAGAREMPRSARILFLIRVLIWPLRAGKVRRSHKAWGILDRLPYGHIRKVRARIPYPCRVRSRVSPHNPSAFLASKPVPGAVTVPAQFSEFQAPPPFLRAFDLLKIRKPLIRNAPCGEVARWRGGEVLRVLRGGEVDEVLRWRGAEVLRCRDGGLHPPPPSTLSPPMARWRGRW